MENVSNLTLLGAFFVCVGVGPVIVIVVRFRNRQKQAALKEQKFLQDISKTRNETN